MFIWNENSGNIYEGYKKKRATKPLAKCTNLIRKERNQPIKENNDIRQSFLSVRDMQWKKISKVETKEVNNLLCHTEATYIEWTI